MWRRPPNVALRRPGRHVTAIDPFEDGIARARQQLPDTLMSRVELRTVVFC
jgi:hypothetical protein